MGSLAGYNNITTGSNNIIIGYNATATAAAISNEITLGNADITKFRIPGIGVSFSDGGGVTTGIMTASAFKLLDGSSIGGLDASVGSYNVIGGSSAGAQLTNSANRDTLIGTEAGTVLTSGEKNTFVGAFAGKFQSTSNRNTAFGASALVQNSGDANTAVGFEALSGESERLSMF